ncbi:MAG: MFS transporter [Candidatus Pacebacteria bacterium]|nr:MFS transporter [Candidatus Paceibacterota bacterium]
MATHTKQGRSPWIVFLLVTVAQFMVVLDISITNVALPVIKSQLNFTDSSLQWVITAYALAFGGFLLLGGRAADLYGRRTVLLTGLIAFSSTSFLIGMSSSAAELIVLRAIQGLAAAFMSPSALSIVLTTFGEGPDRNRALAYWTLVATGGAAVGLLLGGFLTEFVNWRWNFFINVPIGIVDAILILRMVPKHEKEERNKSLDLPGATLVTSSLIAFVFGFSQGPAWGWLSFPVLGVLGLAVLLLVGFIYNESRSSHPLMPLSIFKIRNVSGANLMMAPIYAGMLGTFFLTTLYLQNVLGYSPAIAGLSYLPFPIILAVMSTRIPKLVERYGFKRFLIIGPLLAAAGMLLMGFLPVHGDYFLNLLPTFILVPLGMGVTFMPVIAAATSGVPAHEAGLASGLITTSQQMGGALGLSILSGVATSVAAASTGLDPATALVHGFNAAFFTAAGFMFFAMLLGALVIKQPKGAQGRVSAQQIAEAMV